MDVNTTHIVKSPGQIIINLTLPPHSSLPPTKEKLTFTWRRRIGPCSLWPWWHFITCDCFCSHQPVANIARKRAGRSSLVAVGTWCNQARCYWDNRTVENWRRNNCVGCCSLVPSGFTLCNTLIKILMTCHVRGYCRPKSIT